MSLNTTAIINVLQSHAQSTGLFDRVNTHEPKNAPGNGLTAVITVDTIVPYNSGLISTTVVTTFMVRLLIGMLTEPQDSIDTTIVDACDVLVTAYSGDFELGSQARCIDLLGETGTSLNAKAGYINIDNKTYRVMDIIVPVIINDVWTQGA